MHDHMEVIYELCVPHFYHAFRNLLIINAFNILHREVKVWYSISYILIENLN